MADHIQIGDVSPRIQYTITAGTVSGPWTYDFPIFKDADMAVYYDGVKMTLTTHFTVAGAGSSGGGTVSPVVGQEPVIGTVVTLVREIAIQRTSDFQESGEFRAKVLNDELDYLTAALQQVDEKQGRSLQLSQTQAGAIDPTVPSPSASTTIMWNATGDGLTNGPTAEDVANAQANAASAATDAAIATTKATEAVASAAAAASFVTPGWDTFADGVDFTAGTSTYIDLTATLSSKDFLRITFLDDSGTGYTVGHDEISISGSPSRVTFTSAIPLGTAKIGAEYGVRAADVPWSNVSATPTTAVGYGIATGAHVDGMDQGVATTDDVTFNTVTINGDLIFQGSAFTVDTTTVTTSDNLIVINDGEVGAGVTAGTAGIEVDRGSATNYQFMFRESDDAFVIGEVGSLQAVATREDTPTDNGLAYWDAATLKFKSDGPTWDGSTLAVGGAATVTTLTTSGNAGIGAAVSASTTLNLARATDNQVVSQVTHSGTSPYGIDIDFSAAAPDNQTNFFLQCQDSGAVKFNVWSDGGFTAAGNSTINGTLSSGNHTISSGTVGLYSGLVGGVPYIQGFDSGGGATNRLDIYGGSLVALSLSGTDQSATFAARVQCESLRVNETESAGTATVARTIPINIGGVTRHIMLADSAAA